MKEPSGSKTDLVQNIVRDAQMQNNLRQYVKDADKFYWGLTKERIAFESERLSSRVNRATALALTSTVAAITTLILYLLK